MNSGLLSLVKSDISTAVENYGRWYGFTYAFLLVPIYFGCCSISLFIEQSTADFFEQARNEISEATDKHGRVLGIGYAGLSLLILGVTFMSHYWIIFTCFLLGWGIVD